MVMEVQYRINKMLDDTRVTVTTTAQQIFDMFNLETELRAQVKTIAITNNSQYKIYYGTDATVTDANAGGIIRPSEKVEWPLIDLNWSPYFISTANADMAIVFWG